MPGPHAPGQETGSSVYGEETVRETRVFAVRMPAARQSRDMAADEAEHRARNLIQLAAGLLRAEALRAEAGCARKTLESASDRLVALAQTYAHMEEPGADGQVRLERQLRTLCRAWDDESRGARVRLLADAQPVTCPARKARAITLLANEAITNALKHAYPDMVGEVLVRLHRCGAGRLRLTIEDAGRGLSACATDGFGFNLMRTLAREFEGDFEIHSDEGRGAVISVEFPDPQPCASPARPA